MSRQVSASPFVVMSWVLLVGRTVGKMKDEVNDPISSVYIISDCRDCHYCLSDVDVKTPGNKHKRVKRPEAGKTIKCALPTECTAHLSNGMNFNNWHHISWDTIM